MSESAGKLRKRYIYYPEGKPKPTCLIHGPGHSSDECEDLGDLGSKYVKSRPTKYSGHNPIPRNKFNIYKDMNAVVNSAVDEILLQENQKVSADNGSHENTESDFDEKKLYQINNTSLDDTKKKN